MKWTTLFQKENMKVALLLLPVLTFVTFGQGCLENTDEIWKPDKSTDLTFEKSSFVDCRDKLFGEREYMGFTFQVRRIALKGHS